MLYTGLFMSIAARHAHGIRYLLLHYINIRQISDIFEAFICKYYLRYVGHKSQQPCCENNLRRPVKN